MNQHDCGGIGAREMFLPAFRIGAGRHMAGLFRQRATAATAAESLFLLPMGHGFGIKQQSALFCGKEAVEFAQWHKSSNTCVETQNPQGLFFSTGIGEISRKQGNSLSMNPNENGI